MPGTVVRARKRCSLDYHRVYDPATGKWLSNDPSGFAAGDADLSRYVGNNVASLIDITGLESPTAPFVGAAPDAPPVGASGGYIPWIMGSRYVGPIALRGEQVTPPPVYTPGDIIFARALRPKLLGPGLSGANPIVWTPIAPPAANETPQIGHVEKPDDVPNGVNGVTGRFGPEGGGFQAIVTMTQPAGGGNEYTGILHGTYVPVFPPPADVPFGDGRVLQWIWIGFKSK